MKLLNSVAVSLLLIALTMNGTAYSQVSQVSYWERLALTQLYNATGGDDWTNSEGWNGVAGTECDWHGVRCTSVSPIHVIGISLAGNNLSGPFPTGELWKHLSQLEDLNLSRNNLSGPISALEKTSFTHELSELTNLRALRLSGNNLSGSIPSDLGNIPNLYILDLSNNQFTGSIPAQLANIFTHESPFHIIDLSDNNLSGFIPSSFHPDQVQDTGGATFCLYANDLSGGVPAWWGTADYRCTDGQTGLAYNIETAFRGPNASPSVTISGGSFSSDGLNTVMDTDGVAGETVSFTGTATDSDGTLETIYWLMAESDVGVNPVVTDVFGNNLTGSGGPVVATGLTATLSFPDGWTKVYLQVTDNGGKRTTKEITIYVDNDYIPIPNISPSVIISGGTRTIADTDGAAGESVSFTGTATDSDGTIATTEWLVGGSVVATGLSAAISLPNRSTVVTFKATDNDGASSTTTATITVATPTYTVTDEWPSPYNGVTPDVSLGLAFNNIGVFSASDSIIYTCLRIFTDGLPASVNGIGQFDIGLTVVSLDEGTVQITKFREFNVIGALNENVELPDCSGKFETTTGIYTDVIEAGTSGVLSTTFSLTDQTNLILTLQSYEDLSTTVEVDYTYTITASNTDGFANSSSRAATEGSNITFTITRDGSATSSTVYISTQDSLASSLSGGDYEAIDTRAVTFLHTETERKVVVKTFVDTKDEDDENFNLLLFKTLDDVSAFNWHAFKNGWIKDGGS